MMQSEHGMRRPGPLFMVDAEKLLKSGDVEAATDLCKRGLTRYPESISGYAVLAHAYLRLGRDRRAISVLENGYRRTGAEGLQRLAFQIANPSWQRSPTPDDVSDDTSDEVLQSEPDVSDDESVEDVAGESQWWEDEDSQASGETAETSRPSSDETESKPVPELRLVEREHFQTDLDRTKPDVDVNESESVADTRTEKDGSYKSAESRPEQEEDDSSLSIHSGTEISRIRSNNLRLIPGLEFAPLRRDQDQLRIAPLVESSASNADRGSIRDTGESDSGTSDLQAQNARDQVSPEEELQGRTGDATLDELARQLETAQIPAAEESDSQRKRSSLNPEIITETYANILVTQGALREAIEAYRILSERNPGRHGEYARAIADLERRLSG